MNCTEVREALDDLVDGLLPEARRGEVQAHLRTCPACRRMQAELEAICAGLDWLGQHSAALLETAEMSPAESASARPLRISGGRHGGRVRRLWLIPSAIAAGVLLVAGLRWMLPLAGPPAPLDHPAELSATASSSPGAAAPFRFELAEGSREQYVAVPQASRRPGVHVVWLYAIPKPPAAGGEGQT